MKQETVIKPLTGIKALSASVDVIRISFKTVADQFHLNPQNAPTNPAFIKQEYLAALLDQGVGMYGLFLEEKQIGFAAIERANPDTFYLEKLAVLPDYRHMGYGKQLVTYVIEKVKAKNGKEISIGIINENSILKNWYIKLGFIETGLKKFDHLSFTVCFLKRVVY